MIPCCASFYVVGNISLGLAEAAQGATLHLGELSVGKFWTGMHINIAENTLLASLFSTTRSDKRMDTSIEPPTHVVVYPTLS